MNVKYVTTALFLAISAFCLEEAEAGQKLIVVLADGVRWDYINDPKLKGIRRMIDGGVRAPYVEPVYPSLSYPNWYSLVTGLYPENHGMINNYMFDNETNTFFRMIPDINSTDPLWWNEAEPIWITAEKNDMSTALYWWSGCEVRIKDHHPTICERCRFGPPTEEEREDFFERIDDIIEMFKPSKRFSKDRLSLALFYYGPTDYVGHRFGPTSSQVQDAMYDIDTILDKMQSKLKKAGLQKEVNIMVVSDHGMTDISDTKEIDLEKFAPDIKYQVASASSSMIVPQTGALEKLYRDMKNANIKGLNVYKKEEIPEKYHVKNSKRMTPIYLTANEGYQIKMLSDPKKNVDVVPSRYVGHHGFDPNKVKDMRTIFVATGPAFRSGFETEALNITDLYNVMCHVLQLQPFPNNGSWDRVKSMLRDNMHNTPDSRLRSVPSSATQHHYFILVCIVFAIINFKIHFFL